MLDYPQTLKEAQARRYNEWAGNPDGNPYREGDCAYEIFNTIPSYQCQRKNGKGPAGLYCWQHAKKVER